ncbi:TRAP transporter substrate-binding protein DctP [Oceanimonas sp. CHS3-5]|uniref:TRAP transporter substrate-binding protein DctP n=1 Tax=Oceanimonas sp. CHS3-5 TaxID=3068186 RepID=UPI00273E7391|nr:TRAP transporter substrate-binding protein DctP [Oceanimonas sp. CHS3-5]
MKALKPTRLTLALTAALTVTPFLSTMAQAAPTVLKFHSGYAESRPEAGYLNEFAKDVEQLSGGDLKVDVFHAASLGLSEPDVLRILQRGSVDMALLYGEYYTRDAPELAAVYAQGAITEPEQHLQILPTIRDTYEQGYAKWNIKTIGGIVSPVFSVGLHCKEPINSLDGLKDKKVRVWSAQLVDAFGKLDISAQVIPQNDMYMALQTGVVDCAYYLSTVAETVSLHEVTDYEAYLHPWAAVPALFGISERSWKKLSEKQQQVLQQAGEKLWQKTRSAAVDPDRGAIARARRESLGVTMLDDFSAQDVASFQQAAMSAWHTIAERAGPDGETIYDTVTGKLSALANK